MDGGGGDCDNVDFYEVDEDYGWYDKNDDDD